MGLPRAFQAHFFVCSVVALECWPSLLHCLVMKCRTSPALNSCAPLLHSATLGSSSDNCVSCSLQCTLRLFIHNFFAAATFALWPVNHGVTTLWEFDGPVLVVGCGGCCGATRPLRADLASSNWSQCKTHQQILCCVKQDDSLESVASCVCA